MTIIDIVSGYFENEEHVIDLKESLYDNCYKR